MSWLLFAEKGIRFTWCTTCAAAEKCSNCTWHVSANAHESPIPVVREVSKKHPFVELNWQALREQLNQQINLADPDSPAVQKLVSTLRALHLDLADFFPPALQISESPTVARELLVQLRLLQSTIQVKLEQFRPGRGRLECDVDAAGDARRRS